MWINLLLTYVYIIHHTATEGVQTTLLKSDVGSHICAQSTLLCL